ncbi:hypothetical protein LguiA_017684 [Lonicera macranthoides]
MEKTESVVQAPITTLHSDEQGEKWTCHRTDGKKWKCSRKVVLGTNYCEWHVKRDKSRSRKLLEGQNSGHVVYRSPVAAEVALMASSPSASTVSSNSASNSL